jgi:hypothetical protein
MIKMSDDADETLKLPKKSEHFVIIVPESLTVKSLYMLTTKRTRNRQLQ